MKKKLELMIQSNSICYKCTCGSTSVSQATSALPQIFMCKCGAKYVIKGLKVSSHELTIVEED